MNRKRKAHYLSVFYLAGFTPSGRRTDLLFVSSKAQNRQWRDQAEDVGHKRDLFTPEGPDLGAEEIEDAFADVENAIAPVLRRTIETGQLPVDIQQLDVLLHMVALNAARPPAVITELQDTLDELVRGQIVETTTPEQHARILDALRAEGKDTHHIEDLDALKERIRAGRIRAQLRRDPLLVLGVLGRSAMLVEIFARRRWTLLTAPEGTEFICSDAPVNLLNNINVPVGTSARYTDSRFDVIMPLSKKYCLIGHHGPKSGAAIASLATVAFINGITETGARDYVYSASATYVAETGPDAANEYRSDLARTA